MNSLAYFWHDSNRMYEGKCVSSFLVTFDIPTSVEDGWGIKKKNTNTSHLLVVQKKRNIHNDSFSHCNARSVLISQFR